MSGVKERNGWAEFSQTYCLSDFTELHNYLTTYVGYSVRKVCTVIGMIDYVLT